MSQSKVSPSLVLIMHTPMAAALKQCAAHVLGNQMANERLLCFDIDADVEVELEIQRLYDIIGAHCAEQIILLNDLYGATPYRIAQHVHQRLREQNRQTYLVTGLSLPMLLKAMTDIPTNGLAAYAQRIASTADRAAIIE